ncbi:5-formyltetrahydrofolate cyclo-ligase [Nocardia sp. alder85J]|uniref:5-formyltetrahydrofolate cyclo-ligase n=1 Tax=Nocardia sp. alder85J TaxID=2862949 RepID=UPI001CD7AB35|nr:5-formyltetrahydrofolate cyclo-ligase [Nocardia sp. alder85J]MCX4097090.1 5-formyltetrahydrofolate cyclo-ligase [Nocardia sp. alder85J]
MSNRAEPAPSGSERSAAGSAPHPVADGRAQPDPAGRDKQSWRAELTARRAAVPPEVRAAEADTLADAVRVVIDRPGRWVAGYVPVGSEPGSLAMLDTLRAAGARVLLPLTGPPGPLDWAEYTGPAGLRPARYGLLEPDGPALSPQAIERAQVILVPALAVDRRGVRLGRGAGYYDRTLTAAATRAHLVAVVRDDELIDRLPEEPHDRRMHWALTPGGLHRLPGDTAADRRGIVR